MINMTADEIIICGITAVEWVWALYNHAARKQDAPEMSFVDAEKILGEEGIRQQVGLWNGTVPMGRIKIDKVRGVELGIVLDPEGVDCTEYNRLYDNAAVIVAAERRQERAAVAAQDAVRNAMLFA